MPDASQMCAVSTDISSSSRSTNVFYSWAALATAPCALISPGDAYCYNVGEYGYLVVGHGGAFLSSSAQSWSSRRRALLGSIDDENEDERDSDYLLIDEEVRMRDWSYVSDPCSSLAQKYYGFVKAERMRKGDNSSSSRYYDDDDSPLGVMDRLTLRKCVHWRRVGRRFIETFNATALGVYEDEHFLISLTDFVSVVRYSRCC